MIFWSDGEENIGSNSNRNNHNRKTNERFRRLLDDYAEIYRSSRSGAEKSIVVTEVVLLWRSQEPAGRFLIRTEPDMAETSPYHDIGDDFARERAARLLQQQNENSTTTTINNNKQQDDRTASTSGSSCRASSNSNHRNGDNQRGGGKGTRLRNNVHNNHHGDCFGGSFRMTLMSFFTNQSKNGTMNQFLP